jgi:hypothetical protein
VRPRLKGKRLDRFYSLRSARGEFDAQIRNADLRARNCHIWARNGTVRTFLQLLSPKEECPRSAVEMMPRLIGNLQDNTVTFDLQNPVEWSYGCLELGI